MKPKNKNTNKTLSNAKYPAVKGFYYLEEDVKECFDRIKKRLFEETSKRKMDCRDLWEIIDEEIGDDLK